MAARVSSVETTWWLRTWPTTPLVVSGSAVPGGGWWPTPGTEGSGTAPTSPHPSVRASSTQVGLPVTPPPSWGVFFVRMCLRGPERLSYRGVRVWRPAESQPGLQDCPVRLETSLPSLLWDKYFLFIAVTATPPSRVDLRISPAPTPMRLSTWTCPWWPGSAMWTTADARELSMLAARETLQLPPPPPPPQPPPPALQLPWVSPCLDWRPHWVLFCSPLSSKYIDCLGWLL